jgi:hypothetical protein
MNSRYIALGTTIVALALAGPAQAGTGDLGEIAPKLPETEVAANVQANVDVKAKADVPLKLPLKGTHGSVRPAAKVDTTVKAKGETGTSGAGVRLGGSGHLDTGTGRLGARVGIEQDARLEAVARKHGVAGKVTAVGRSSAKGEARIGHGRISGKARGHLKHSAKARTRGLEKPRFDIPKHGNSKHGLPLRGIGREVGNPIQLSLAGWLIALTGAMCFGASRFVRRLQRLGS